MSDKIKADYTRYMENVEPSNAFLSQLTQTLKDEQNRQKQKNVRWIKQALMAAACILLILGISGIFYEDVLKTRRADEENSFFPVDMTNYVKEASSEALNTVSFENIGWYDDSLTGVSIPEALAQKLDTSLDYLAYGNENKFVNAEQADIERIQQIIGLLSEAEESSGEASGSRLYYMAVFTDGTIAKFSIVSDTYIEISGDEKIYKKAEN